MLVESDRSVEARRHLINATKPTKVASLLANKSKSMAIRPAASAAVTARPVSAPATSATTSGEEEEEPLPGDEAEEGDGEGEEDEEEAGAATGPNPSASKAQLAGHVSMLRAKDIHSELILQALNSQSG